VPYQFFSLDSNISKCYAWKVKIFAKHSKQDEQKPHHHHKAKQQKTNALFLSYNCKAKIFACKFAALFNI
jgi:hypothetical protein